MLARHQIVRGCRAASAGQVFVPRAFPAPREDRYQITPGGFDPSARERTRALM